MMNANADRTDGHLDELALDALRAGAGSAADAAHAASCPRCRAALAGLGLLEARLKAAQAPIPAVPTEIEARIFRAYREAVDRRAPAPFASLVRRWTLPAAGLVAATAAVTLTLRLAPPDEARKALREPAPVAVAPTPVPAPADGLGAPQAAAAVDIVDAFRLARALRDGRQVASGWDADGNGLVDGADVRAVARRAVAL
jgi:hypothetical protein